MGLLRPHVPRTPSWATDIAWLHRIRRTQATQVACAGLRAGALIAACWPATSSGGPMCHSHSTWQGVIQLGMTCRACVLPAGAAVQAQAGLTKAKINTCGATDYAQVRQRPRRAAALRPLSVPAPDLCHRRASRSPVEQRVWAAAQGCWCKHLPPPPTMPWCRSAPPTRHAPARTWRMRGPCLRAWWAWT